MLNYIWAGMILLGIIYGTLTGNMEALSNAAMDSAGEAVSLCITTLGIMALWMGLMEIAQKSGLIAKLTKGIQPFISFLFPGIPKGHEAREYISTNMIANILGLGWACTPAGLKAMEELAKLEEERGNPAYVSADGSRRRRKEQEPAGEGRQAWRTESGTALLTAGKDLEAGTGKRKANAGERVASNEMCTFLILNISSLQLIPVNMIAYRQQYGSVNPAGIIAPAIVATFISTTVAVVYCKMRDRRRRV